MIIDIQDNLIFQPKEIQDKIKKFMKQKKGFLLLYGNPGTGKTFLLREMYRVFNVPFEDKEMITVTDLFIQKEKEFFEWKTSYNTIEKYRALKFLVLDDICANSSGASDSKIDFLYSIINFRYDNNLPTCFSTNMTSEKMCENLGDALISRIVSGERIALPTGDRRLLPQNKWMK